MGVAFNGESSKSRNYQAGTKDSQKLNSISYVCERLFSTQGTRLLYVKDLPETQAVVQTHRQHPQ